MDKRARDLIKELEAKGYSIRKDHGMTVKHTLEIPKALHEKFFKIVNRRKVRIKDAVAEMFEDFCEKYREK